MGRAMYLALPTACVIVPLSCMCKYQHFVCVYEFSSIVLRCKLEC